MIRQISLQENMENIQIEDLGRGTKDMMVANELF